MKFAWRRNRLVAHSLEFANRECSGFRIEPAAFGHQVRIVEARRRRGDPHDIGAVPRLAFAQPLNRIVLGHAIAAAQARHSVNFGKGARDDEVAMLPDQRNHALILRTVGVMIIRLVHQNHGVVRHALDKLAHFVFRSDAGGGIIRIADVNQAALRCGQHLPQIVTKIRRERNFHDLCAVALRMVKDGFEGRIGDHERAALAFAQRTGENVGGQLENLARAVAEQDLIAAHAIEFGERFHQRIGVLVGITTSQRKGIAHRLECLGRRAVGILVRTQTNDTGDGGRGFARRGFGKRKRGPGDCRRCARA